MSTGPEHPATSGRAGHEDRRDYVDRDVVAPEPLAREGEYTDHDLASDDPTDEREGEYTDSDVGPDDADPPVGSYTDRDG